MSMRNMVERGNPVSNIPTEKGGTTTLVVQIQMHVRGAWPAMPYTLYTVYTPIGGIGRCRTSCDLQDHSKQARKSAGKRSTLALKAMRKDT